MWCQNKPDLIWFYRTTKQLVGMVQTIYLGYNYMATMFQNWRNHAKSLNSRYTTGQFPQDNSPYWLPESQGLSNWAIIVLPGPFQKHRTASYFEISFLLNDLQFYSVMHRSKSRTTWLIWLFFLVDHKAQDFELYCTSIERPSRAWLKMVTIL